MPVIGLYFSLRCRNFISAFLSTLAAGLLLPLAVPLVLEFVWRIYSGTDSCYYPSGGLIPRAPASYSLLLRPYGVAALCQFVLAVIFWQRLYRCLQKRAFPMEELR